MDTPGANQLHSPWLPLVLAARAAAVVGTDDISATECAGFAAEYLSNTPGAQAAFDSGLAAAGLGAGISARQLLAACISVRMQAYTATLSARGADRLMQGD
ncbi:hypothetical protein ABPG75_007872 [Micractinium tetrahymenae]